MSLLILYITPQAPDSFYLLRITHPLRLASFWDPAASRAVFQLDELLAAVSLDKTTQSEQLPMRLSGFIA